jgi:TPP-dependent pyruvate/acetoin dehydrogenase alpha subunit
LGILKDLLIQMFEKMLLIRIVEEKIIDLYRAGVKGLYHLSTGQKAVAVGVCAALKKDDYVFTTHRGRGITSVRLFPRESAEAARWPSLFSATERRTAAPAWKL